MFCLSRFRFNVYDFAFRAGIYAFCRQNSADHPVLLGASEAPDAIHYPQSPYLIGRSSVFPSPISPKIRITTESQVKTGEEKTGGDSNTEVAFRSSSRSLQRTDTFSGLLKKPRNKSADAETLPPRSSIPAIKRGRSASPLCAAPIQGSEETQPNIFILDTAEAILVKIVKEMEGVRSDLSAARKHEENIFKEKTALQNENNTFKADLEEAENCINQLVQVEESSRPGRVARAKERQAKIDNLISLVRGLEKSNSKLKTDLEDANFRLDNVQTRADSLDTIHEQLTGVLQRNKDELRDACALVHKLRNENESWKNEMQIQVEKKFGSKLEKSEALHRALVDGRDKTISVLKQKENDLSAELAKVRSELSAKQRELEEQKEKSSKNTDFALGKVAFDVGMADFDREELEEFKKETSMANARADKFSNAILDMGKEFIKNGGEFDKVKEGQKTLLNLLNILMFEKGDDEVKKLREFSGSLVEAILSENENEELKNSLSKLMQLNKALIKKSQEQKRDRPAQI